MNSRSIKQKVISYYDQDATGYAKMYSSGFRGYPTNVARLNLILERLKRDKNIKILDVGCGSAMPILHMLNKGYQVEGFDFSKEMVKVGKDLLIKKGYKPNTIYQADLEDFKTIKAKKYNCVLALGVFPHILDEKKALKNINKLLTKKGKVFIEFRNDLFSLFTFNKYSLQFVLYKLLEHKKIPKKIFKDIENTLKKRLNLNNIPSREKNKISYNDILSKFHNPLTIENELFKPCGFSVNKIHYYHYHGLMPFFREKYPSVFRDLSIQMEDPNNWKGMFMASAFVVEATKYESVN